MDNRKEYYKEYYQKHKEELKARQKAKYSGLSSKEKKELSKKSLEYFKALPNEKKEEIYSQRREWYYKNKEEYNQYRRNKRKEIVKELKRELMDYITLDTETALKKLNENIKAQKYCKKFYNEIELLITSRELRAEFEEYMETRADKTLNYTVIADYVNQQYAQLSDKKKVETIRTLVRIYIYRECTNGINDGGSLCKEIESQTK